MSVRRRHVAMKASIALASFLMTISLIEVTCRLLGLDLERRADIVKAIPIFYRQPTQPVGDVFFRRPGPDLWKGNVLGVGYDELAGTRHNPYLNEPEITASYDSQGFRNPEDLNDWDIVVVGDSFTELGFLPFEDLFTTKLGNLLGVRVKNLGVSNTGTLSQTFYLREYGISRSTRQSIMIFFEGNDIADIETESSLLEQYKATGTRPYRNIQKQTSFLKMVYDDGYAAYIKLRRVLAGNVDAYFVSGTGTIPVSLEHTPPGRNELTSRQIDLLDSSLRQYAETARKFGLTPWLVFMPCKFRANYCCLRFTAKTKSRYVDWKPTDLPALVQELATKNGVRFIDVTPALMNGARSGILTYNSLWDTHLNRDGSRIVAEAVAAEIIRDKHPSP